MAKNRAAVVKGTFLRPTTSQNRRLYTTENIAGAVDRMQESIGSADGLPLTMNTSHGSAAADDSLSTVGKITKVSILEDGSATFEADIADTTAGRDIATLIDPSNPFIKGVSIRGGWGSTPYTVVAPDGNEAVTADELVIKGIDFTWKPGVDGATIDSMSWVTEALANDPTLIFESVDDASVTFVDEATKAPYGDVTYADPGYQKDKQKRYPIDTPKHIRAAWSYINVGENASAYSSNQVKRIKSRIKSAAKKAGIDIVSETQVVVDEIQEVLEAYASVSLDNGAAGISVSGYTDDAGKLSAMAARLAYGAIVALNAIDPDADGDIDLVMPDGSKDSSSSSTESVSVPDDDAMEANADTVICGHCKESVSDTSMYCPDCGQPITNPEESAPAASNSETKEPTMGTEASAATEAAATATTTETAPAAAAAATVTETAVEAPARTLTDGDVNAIGTAFATAIAPLLAPAAPAAVTEAVAPAATETATAAATTETAAAPAAAATAAVTETAETKTYTFEEVTAIAADAAKTASEAAVEAAVEQFRAGGATRKGLVGQTQAAGVVESGEINAETLAAMGGDEFYRTIAPIWEAQPFRFAQYGVTETA